MILVNTDYISGKELETLSLVKGSTIQSKNIGKDIAQSFKTLVGGELKAYNEMMNEARALATKRMVAEAEELGADAVINIRYASSAVMQGAAEVIAAIFRQMSQASTPSAGSVTMAFSRPLPRTYLITTYYVIHFKTS